jgi:nucleoside-diphosphate-sugar epimerase
VPLYGDGGNVRDWLYVEDNAAAQWLVLTDGEPGGVYNVGAGNERSNLELTRAILERFGAGEERIEPSPTVPATTAATRSTPHGSAHSAGRRRCRSRRAGPHDRLVPRARGLVAAAARRRRGRTARRR